MKTTKVFIGLFSVLAVIKAALGYWMGAAYFAVISINWILLFFEEKKNAQLTSKITNAERDSRYWKERFDLANVWNEKDAEHIQELSAELETAKSNSYTEVERKRGREKYARLYKGKKKAEVATEQKSEPIKIEPFRMVVNPKQSAIVQQILFDNGYAWASGDKKVMYLHSKNLFLEDVITSYDERFVLDEDRKNLPKLSFSKFMSLYGKKDQPYTIEGKTIKQLVEENLGVDVIIGLSTYYLCGYDARGFKNSLPFIIGKNEDGYSIDNDNAVILSDYTSTIWESKEPVIEAIKKHRNIK